VRVRYTRWWDRFLVVVSPKRRRKLKFMQMTLDQHQEELWRLQKQINHDLTIYGSPFVNLMDVTQSVTSVDPDSDDPKNVGTKPEVFTDGYFRLAEDPLKDGF